jgi:SAM-dependent methyltransferase
MTTEAQEYWSRNHTQGHHDAEPWRQELVREILSCDPLYILEFGCNTGNNLFHINELRPGVFCSGIDINRRNIEMASHRAKVEGLTKLGFSVGNEGCLSSRHDVVFTSSVLDHIPHAREVFDKLVECTSKKLFMLEPYHPDHTGLVPEDISMTPYTYMWDYPSWDSRITWRPLPIHNVASNMGKYYCLFEMET